MRALTNLVTRMGCLIAVIVPLVVSARALGAEPGAAACARAAEQGQDLRKQGKLVTARERFVECSRQSCPNLVRSDCVRWLGELEPSIPTVVLAATAGGRDLVDVVVSLDGEPFASALDGRAEPVDPGPHVFMFRHGSATTELRLVVAEGDKNRKLTGVFALEAPPPPVPTPTREPVERGAKHGPPLVSWILGGIGVAALGSSTYLGLTSKADLAGLRRDCAPNCTDSQVNGVRDRMIVADVALGVGVVAIVAAAWIWLADAGHAQRPTPASSE